MVRKRILYVESNTDGTVGGSHFSLLFLIQGLNKEVYDPVVVFYQDHRLIPRYRQAGCSVLLLKKRKPVNFSKTLPWTERMPDTMLPRLFVRWPLMVIQKAINYVLTFIAPVFHCWYVLMKERIDLVHLNNTLLRPQEWILAAIFTKTKIVAHERGINNLFPFQARFWARFLSRIICISDAVRNNLLKHGFSASKLVRIYNGLDQKDFMVTRDKTAVFAELGISTNSPVLGIVGNMKQWKGQETVVKAMIQIRKSIPGVKCLIIGGVSPSDADYLTRLKKIITDEGMQDTVIFTGPRTDIPDLVNCLSVLVHASILPEPFGRVLLEGMIIGKPVITTAIGAGPEIVVDGNTGLVVTPGDDKELARALVSLLNDPERAISMGLAGQRRVLNAFTIQKNVVDTEEVYAQILH